MSTRASDHVADRRETDLEYIVAVVLQNVMHVTVCDAEFVHQVHQTFFSASVARMRVDEFARVLLLGNIHSAGRGASICLAKREAAVRLGRGGNRGESAKPDDTQKPIRQMQDKC